MADSPKDNQERMQRILAAWETLAPTKPFGGMTLEQYRTAIQPSQVARQQLEALETQTIQAINVRNDADEVSMAKSAQVVDGIRGDPTEGPDSALIEAIGYVRKSERKSGLTRKKGKQPPSAPSP